MQPCESTNYVVELGIVIGVGSHASDPNKAATAAQNDAITKITTAANAAKKANKERCQSDCEPVYHVSAEFAPAFGPGPPYALQMPVYWTLYMDCKKRVPAPPPPHPLPKPKVKPPVPPNKGKIVVKFSDG
jgi:hypothetical protein